MAESVRIRAQEFMDKPITKRALRKAATRVAVIEAARQVFQDRGYEGATIAEIAKAARVSPGTVLNAAATKIALLNAVMMEDFKRLGMDCEDLLASLSSEFKGSVVAVLEQHLQRHWNELGLVSALIGHMWLDGGEEFSTFKHNLDLAWGPIRKLVETAGANDALVADLSADEICLLLQDIYLGVIRRCASGELDLFAASTVLHRHVEFCLNSLSAERPDA